MMTFMTAEAIPARPGRWQIVKLKDGTEVVVQMRGDEWGHFLADMAGNAYVPNGDGTYSKTTPEEAVNGKEGSARYAVRKAMQAQRQMALSKAPRKASAVDKSKFQGKKRGLIILAQYQDVKFSTTTPAQFGCTTTKELYDKIINTRNLDMSPFHGSVKDYFLEQSDGQFELDFDVVGPVTLDNDRDYYGGNIYQRSGESYSKVTEDGHAGYQAYEAMQKADEQGVDFSKYDWDGDGECEVIYILYAGQGEADGGDEWCVWPHKFTLSSAASNESYYGRYNLYYKDKNGSYTQFSKQDFGKFEADGVKADIYACSNELATNEYYSSSKGGYVVNGLQLCGIGTICHEFSHTMGYPDMYDTSYSYAGPQMGSWDLMCSGSYNGSWDGGNSGWKKIDAGYCPAGYTAYERWVAGWLEPKVLTDATEIKNLKPLGGTPAGGPTDHGDAYVVYMPESEQSIDGEYYLISNVERANWDSALPWFGLLVNYVDYSQTYWNNNKLNTPKTAGHEHMTIFQAGGKNYLGSSFLGVSMDTYPYKVSYWPRVFSSSASFYDADGATMAANLNSLIKNDYSSYAGYISLNTSDNNVLDDQSSPSAYYYNSDDGTTANTLTDHEIWDIETNGDYDRTVNFKYRKPGAAVGTLVLDETVTEAQDLSTAGFYNVTLKRSMKSTDTWYTMWLPFSLKVSELASYFGEGAQVASFDGEGANADNTVTGLKFLTDEQCVNAYTPFIVKPGNAIESIDFGQQYVFAKPDAISCEAGGYTFVGTDHDTQVPSGGIVLSGNKYYVTKGTTMLYAYRGYFTKSTAESKAAKVSKADGSQELAFLNPGPSGRGVEAVTLPQADPLWLELSEIANQHNTTGITDLQANQKVQKNDRYYSISGQQIDARNLPNGVYIHNGKKIIKK